MSKYTTEVRYICEQKSELEESKGFTSVDDVINKSWNKIFTTNVNFFDENYKQVICKKILKHYYMREIGCETVGLWMLWMNTRLAAAFLDRAHVFFIFLIKKIDLSLIGVYMTVTSVSGRIYAVKEINAALYAF